VTINVEKGAPGTLNIVLPAYICTPQRHHALLCPMWQPRCHRLCPHQASNSCDISEQPMRSLTCVIRCKLWLLYNTLINTYLVGLPKPMLSSWGRKKETHFKYTQWILHTRAWSNCSMPATQQFNRSAWHLRLKVHLYLTVTRGETSVLADHCISFECLKKQQNSYKKYSPIQNMTLQNLVWFQKRCIYPCDQWRGAPTCRMQPTDSDTLMPLLWVTIHAMNEKQVNASQSFT